jgi:hypothetical protein
MTVDITHHTPWKIVSLLLDGNASEYQQLQGLLHDPLSHVTLVQHYAPAFAKLARHCLEDINSGVYTRKPYDGNSANSNSIRERHPSFSGIESNDKMDVEEEISNDSPEFSTPARKVKWEALRSFSFALMDGPILAMNKWCQEEDERKKAKRKGSNKLPSRETMIMYLERIKNGLDVVKITFGPEWMYIWLLNEYGRAINARMYIDL